MALDGILTNFERRFDELEGLKLDQEGRKERINAISQEFTNALAQINHAQMTPSDVIRIQSLMKRFTTLVEDSDEARAMRDINKKMRETKA